MKITSISMIYQKESPIILRGSCFSMRCGNKILTQKNNRIKNSNSNSPHGTVNNLNSSHLRLNQDLTYYQPHNNIENNQDSNRKIDNISVQKKKKRGQLKEYSSKKPPLFVI